MTPLDPDTPLEPSVPIRDPAPAGGGTTVVVAVLLAAVFTAGLGWIASAGGGDDVVDPVAETRQPADPTLTPAADVPVAGGTAKPGTTDATGSVVPAAPAPAR